MDVRELWDHMVKNERIIWWMKLINKKDNKYDLVV
jgi:hypothetical protein